MRAEIAVTSVPVVPHPEEEDRKMLRELVGEGCRQGLGSQTGGEVRSFFFQEVSF